MKEPAILVVLIYIPIFFAALFGGGYLIYRVVNKPNSYIGHKLPKDDPHAQPTSAEEHVTSAEDQAFAEIVRNYPDLGQARVDEVDGSAGGGQAEHGVEEGQAEGGRAEGSQAEGGQAEQDDTSGKTPDDSSDNQSDDTTSAQNPPDDEDLPPGR